jgi:hypothetical protein
MQVQAIHVISLTLMARKLTQPFICHYNLTRVVV